MSNVASDGSLCSATVISIYRATVVAKVDKADLSCTSGPHAFFYTTAC